RAAGIGPGEKSVDVFSAERDHDGPFLTSFRDTRFRAARNPEIAARDSGFVLRTPRNDGMSGAGVEERRQPGLEVFRNLLGCAILGIPERALAREALQIARNVVIH